MTRTFLATVAGAALVPLAVSAGTVTTTLNYSGSDNLLGSNLGFNESANVDLGIAVVDFGARASAGSVDADASARVTARFADQLTYAASKNAVVDLVVDSVRSSFETFIGATAFAGLDFDPISIPIPFAPDININPPRATLGEIGYTMETASARNGFGTSSDVGNEAITGFGVPTIPLISVQAELTLDGSQTSSLSVDEMFGIVQATHEDGTVLTDTFALTSSASSVFDLSLAGSWDLELVGVGLSNVFDTSLGLAGSARAGFAAGVNCGDFSTDSDNGFGCIFDTGTRATTPQLTLINPAATFIDWGTQNVQLGSILVAAQPVPLPAGAAMMLTGAAVFGLARRRQRKTRD